MKPIFIYWLLISFEDLKKIRSERAKFPPKNFTIFLGKKLKISSSMLQVFD